MQFILSLDKTNNSYIFTGRFVALLNCNYYNGDNDNTTLQITKMCGVILIINISIRT